MPIKPPLWSPRWQTVVEGEENVLQYKPFPAYPQWLEAWRVPTSGSGGGGVLAPRHLTLLPHQWQVTEGSHTIDQQLTQKSTHFSTSMDNPSSRKTTFLLETGETGNYQFSINAIKSAGGGIMKVYLQGDLLYEDDLYAEETDIEYISAYSFNRSLIGETSFCEMFIVCDSKNAESASYFLPFGTAWFTPTDF